MLEEKYKYSTHVLELVRNNGKSSEKENMDRGFLMFDYFDILIHKELKGEEKVYSNYFSIEDTFEDDRDYKVSFKTLSLYCGADCDENPFTLGKTPPEDEAEATLSEIPFLGLIQISLCRENYEWKLVESYKDVDEFLKRCEDKIMETVSNLDCFADQDLTVMQLYRSSTTGDFCLAIRTDSVKKIYRAALALNDSQNVPDDFPKVLTYTNVGIECKMGPDKSYSTLAPEFIENHVDINFAVRFSADKGVLPLLTELDPDGKKYKAIKGLFGRYDYLVHINLKDFADIYPLLCEKKFGVLKNSGFSDREHISILENILQYSNVENINERILVDLDLPSGIQPDSEKDAKSHQLEKGSWVEAVTSRNKELYDRIQGLDKWKRYFSEENRSFRDLHRCMIGIYKTFSAIGMEKEAYLNWRMFGQDMEMLCECLELCLQKYSKINEDCSMDEQQRKTYRLRLLKDWRINIQAINQYTRLVQNINYQTYQSPIYEIQTQIDTEKTMIAYRQAMRSYMDSYVTSGIIDVKDTAQIVPIIFPDLSKDRVEVTAPFISQKKDDVYLKRAIMCTVPSFEYFGRLYDLLPWLLHESSHHLRVIERRKRNEFLVKYLFSHIYTVVLENSLPYLANDSLYWAAGR